MLEDRQHRVADGVPGRLVAGDDQQQEVVVEVPVGQRHPVPWHLVDQPGDQVGARATTPLAGQLPPEGEDFERRGGAEGEVAVPLALHAVQEDVGVVGVGVADDAVAPVDEPLVVLGRHVEQAGEDVDGEVGLHLLDEVEGAPGQGGIQGSGGQAAQEVGLAADDARAELALEQPAQGPVAQAVEFEQGGAPPDLVVVDLLQVDEPAWR